MIVAYDLKKYKDSIEPNCIVVANKRKKEIKKIHIHESSVNIKPGGRLELST